MGIVSAVNRTAVTHLVTSADLLPRVLSIASKTPSLTHIVYMENASSEQLRPSVAQGLQVIPFSSLETLGSQRYLQECRPEPDDIAIIMFTSGSTGIPKGVMATHSNLMTTMRSFAFLCQSYGAAGSEDVYIAFLPLAHMLELSFEILLMSVGGRIGYSSPLTLTDKSNGIDPSCRGDATVLKPTQITCVPLVADRIRKGINEMLASKGALHKALFDYAVRYKCRWLDLGFETPILNRILFNKTSQVLGGKTKLIVSGSAPLSSPDALVSEGLPELLDRRRVWFVRDELRDHRYGPAGDEYGTRGTPASGLLPAPGRLAGRGYFEDEELTRESFREEGGIRWFYTGDIGEIFPDGTLKIIDRKKDIVKLQHGEYVALVGVEAVLKSCPLVENAFVYGNSREHLATMKELCTDSVVASAAEEFILNYARSCDLQKTEVPRKVKLCHEEWTPDTGLVTPTLKLCRKPLQKYYERDINALYESEEESVMPLIDHPE
ncbi:hypothetical protein MTO96_006560 [Rhipicephalus appendiculatus]